MSDSIPDGRRASSKQNGIPFSVGLRDFLNLADNASVNPQRPEGGLRVRPATKDPLSLLSSPSSRSEVDVCTLTSASTCYLSPSMYSFLASCCVITYLQHSSESLYRPCHICFPGLRFPFLLYILPDIYIIRPLYTRSSCPLNSPCGI